MGNIGTVKKYFSLVPLAMFMPAGYFPPIHPKGLVTQKVGAPRYVVTKRK